MNIFVGIYWMFDEVSIRYHSVSRGPLDQLGLEQHRKTVMSHCESNINYTTYNKNLTTSF